LAVHCRLLASKGKQISTYSVGFTGPGEEAWNELPLARLVADRWGTEHHEIVLNPESLLDDLVDMVWHLDEPYGGGLPSWAVFKQMKGRIKVAMTGTGGDELFGNYGKWRRLDSSWLGCLFKLSDPNSEDFRRKFFNHHYYLSDQAKQEKVFANNYGDYDTSFWLFKEYFQSARAISIRDRSASTDIATQLPEEFLMMTDRFSMAHSIEARTPFLDHRLAELVLGLPSQLRTSHGDLKGLLRESITDLLPPQLLTAPKRGFVIPLNYWLRSKLRPVVEYLLEPKRLIAQGVFRPEFNRYYVKPHLTGNADYTHIVWAAMMFQLWYLIFIDGQGKRPSFKISDLLK
jgi:asparagine synthase (glutamine-hydrolysing)